MPALSIPAAVVALQGGGVIAYPTEAVWGLGCDPFDEAAVMRLLALKQREVAKGLILIAGALDAFEHLLDWDALPTDRREAVFATWPGPHTWIVPASGRVPHWITGLHDGVAVRGIWRAAGVDQRQPRGRSATTATRRHRAVATERVGRLDRGRHRRVVGT